MVYIDKLFKMKQPMDNIKLVSSKIVGSDIIYFNEENRSKSNRLIDFLKFQKIGDYDNIVIPKNITFLNRKIINTKHLKNVREKYPKVTSILKRSRIIKNHNLFDLSSIQPEFITRIHTGTRIKAIKNLFEIINKMSLDFKNNPTIRGSKLEAKERNSYLFLYNNITESEIIYTDILDSLHYLFKMSNFKINKKDLNIDGIVYIINKRYFPLTRLEIETKDGKEIEFLYFNQPILTKIKSFINNFNKTDDEVGKHDLNDAKLLIKDIIDNSPELEKGEKNEESLNRIKDVIHNTNDNNLLNLNFDDKIKYIFKEIYGASNVSTKYNKNDKEDLKTKENLKLVKSNYKKLLKNYHGTKTLDENILSFIDKDLVFKPSKIVGLKNLSGYDRQKIELKENIDNKMFDLFKTLENDPDINIKIKDIKVDLVDEYNNRYKNYKIRLSHAYGKTYDKPYTISLKVPYAIEEKYIKINGNNYIMINQFFPKPIHKVNQNLVRMYTHFNTGSFKLKSSALDKKDFIEIEKSILNKLKLLNKNSSSKINLKETNFTTEEKLELIDIFNIPKSFFIHYKFKNLEIKDSKYKYVFNFDYENKKPLQFYSKFSLEDQPIRLEYSYIKEGTIYTEHEDGDLTQFDISNLDEFMLEKLNDISINLLKMDLYKKSKTSSPTFIMNLPGIKNKGIVNYLAFILGFEESMKKLNIKYTTSDNRSKDSFLTIKFKNTNVNFFPDTKFKEFMVNGFKLHKYDNIELSNNFMEIIYKKDLGFQMEKYRELSNKFIDNSTKKALKENNFSDNLLDLISTTIPNMLLNREKVDVNELDNYRLRMSETISNVAYEVVQQAIVNFKGKKDNANEKIDLDKNYIFSNLISAGILQETIAINPLEELMLTMKVTKTGVGNAKKNMVTLDRRDLNPSYFGQVSPTATNEYGGIGANQTLTNGFLLSDYEGSISKKPFNNDSNPFENLAPVESLSAFLEFDDTTRRVMGNQQTGQFVQLDNPDEPLVQTGFESYIPHLVSDRFTKKAKQDGKIKSIQDGIITIVYKNNKEELIDINDIKSRTKRGIYLPTKYTSKVNEGQVVKKGQILASTSSLKSGKLSIGKNTTVALLPYMGQNFEDGWAVTNKLNTMFKHSILKRIIIPIPPNAKINNINLQKGISTTVGDSLIEYMIDSQLETMYDTLDDDNDIFTGMINHDRETTYNSPGGVIKELIVKINDLKTTPKEIKSVYNTSIKPLKDKINNCKEFNKDKEELFDCMGNTENINTLKIGNHKLNGKEFDGAIIEVYIEIDNPIINGTKFTLGATGGKGTVQYTIPKGLEPKSTTTNMQIDFIPTSIGIIKRKNISIILMLYLGKVIYFLNETVKELARQNNIDLIKSTVMSIVAHLDKTKDSQLISQLEDFFKQKTNVIYNIINKSNSLTKPAFPAIVPPQLNKLTVKDIENAANVLGIPLNEKVYIPEVDMTTETEVPVGILPIYLLEHFPKAMSSVRGSLFNKREFVSGQGRSGTREGAGSNKIGLYDMNSLLTEQPYHLIKELHTLRSDAPKARKKFESLLRKSTKDGTYELPNLDEIILDDEKDMMSKRSSEVMFIGAGLEPHF